MMGRTHRAWSDVFWLGTTGVVNFGAFTTGHGLPVNVAVVGAGLFLAKPFSSGENLSPDMDHRWAPGPPRDRYNWRFHRGITHRVWFASALTIWFCVLPMVVLLKLGLPAALATVALAPVAGWWSHLAGDMIYGRIKILGQPVGLGWETGGLSETGKRRGQPRGYLLPVNPAEKLFLGLSVALMLGQLVMAVASVTR